MTDEQTEQTPDTPEGDTPEPESTDAAGAVDLGAVRELVLAAHPDVVPEMVQGATFDELMASVEPARQAYQRIADQTGNGRTAPRVAAQPGQRGMSLMDVESLSPLGKISEGLKRASSH